MIRFGLCCMFHSVPIHYQTTTVAALQRLDRHSQLAKLSSICLNNAYAVMASVRYCANNNIASFRLSSNLFPIKTHPQIGYDYHELSAWEEIERIYKKCKLFTVEKNIRLGLHPDQFVIMNSDDAALTRKSVIELEHHADVAEMTGADTMNIHVGGMYGEKNAALRQLANNLEDVSDNIYSRLTIENDDKTFTVEDILPWCLRLGIPLVYDVHHDRCNPGSISVAEATEAAWQTWKAREPLMHISSPLGSGKHFRSHHEYISPGDWPDAWNASLGDYTVEIEAKHKELAVHQLQRDLTLRGIL